ncbi:MAG: hypothetical protein JO283_02390 [Bradyrhizobium sp.]|nr:hypothetical protein [Bradyrhizobium sp.]
MHSTPESEQNDPHDVMVARWDEKPDSDYEQTVREELARVHDRPKLLPNDAPTPDRLDPEITTFRPASVDGIVIHPSDRLSRNSPAMRGVIGFVLAACSVAAAVAWESSYGQAARLVLAQWAPQLVSAPSTPAENPERAAQGSPAADQVAVADPAPAQSAAQDESSPGEPSPPADAAAADRAPAQPAATGVTASSQPAAPLQNPPQDDAQKAPAAHAEIAQPLQTMQHDIANLQQVIEQLKASQTQMTRDNAKTAEQLKATQEQLARVAARFSPDQNLKPPKTSAPRPRLTAAPTRKPAATLPPPQVPAQPPQASMPAPTEEPQVSSVPRPPLPVP